MKKTITIYNGTILEEGKKYRWSGNSNTEYDKHIWMNFRCKIKKIDGIEITIYDYEQGAEYIFTDNGFIKVGAIFTPYRPWGFIDGIKKLFKR
jgi:hypothetical protein